MQIRRVVTGYSTSGAPTVVVDGPAPAVVHLPADVGASLVDLWRSDTVPLSTVGSGDPTEEAAFTLMPPGSLFRIIELQPGDHAPLRHTTASPVDFIYIAHGIGHAVVWRSGRVRIQNPRCRVATPSSNADGTTPG